MLRGGGSVEAGRGEQAPGRWSMSASERLPRWVLALGGASARAAVLGAGGEQRGGHRRAVAGLVLLIGLPVLRRTSGKSFLKRMLQRKAVSRLSRLFPLGMRRFHSGPRFFSCAVVAGR